MKVFISYRDEWHRTASSLAEVLTARGLAVRHLNGASPTGYDGRVEFGQELEDHDAVVFIVDEEPSWRQRTALSEVMQRRWAGDDIRLFAVTGHDSTLPGVLEQYVTASLEDDGWEGTVGDAIAADQPPATDTWTADQRRDYLASLDDIARQVSADVSAG